jgi:NAD-dependent DNA ligase
MVFTIQAPTHCPSCNSSLVWQNHLLYCVDTSCGSQIQKKLEHFAKTLKIKGLGPSTLSKLGLDSLHGIYSLSEVDLALCLSSEKIAAKLYLEIQNSRQAPLNLVLPAFSIPLIGTTATTKLSSVISNIFELTEDKCSEAGLGPKATESLMDWFYMEFMGELEELPFNFSFTTVDTMNKPTETKGIVCISGKLKSFSSKDAASKYLEQHGYSVKSTLTKDCTHLINESGIESTKTKNARSKGVTVVTSIEQLISGD